MGTTQVNMREAKSRLSELGELVHRGERVVIARAGKPYLDLTPYRDQRSQRKPGRLSGQLDIAPDFDTTPASVIADFAGGA